jgi:hypothetical protein
VKARLRYAIKLAQAPKRGFFARLNGEEPAAQPYGNPDREQSNHDQRTYIATTSTATNSETAKEVADSLHHLVEIYFWLFGTIHRQSDFRVRGYE